VILQREEDTRKALMPPPPLASSSRPTTSGNPAPLIITTPENVTNIKAILKVNEEISSKLNGVLARQLKIRASQVKMQKHFQDLQLVVQKLANSATIAITETTLSQAINKELINAADEYKNRKKVSKKDKDKITDVRVINIESMEKALEAKAIKKKEMEEKLAKEKKLKALHKS
jgi:hypothetical protein